MRAFLGWQKNGPLAAATGPVQVGSVPGSLPVSVSIGASARAGLFGTNSRSGKILATSDRISARRADLQAERVASISMRRGHSNRLEPRQGDTLPGLPARGTASGTGGMQQSLPASRRPRDDPLSVGRNKSFRASGCFRTAFAFTCIAMRRLRAQAPAQWIEAQRLSTLSTGAIPN